MKKIYLPIIGLIGFCINVNAQEISKIESEGDKYPYDNPTKNEEKSKVELRGDKYSFSYSYDKAIDSYSHSKELSFSGQRMLAEGYRKMNQNVLAEEAYLKLISVPGEILPEDYYNYAMILKINGKYMESNKAMDKFVELKPEDLRAKDYAANSKEFSRLANDDGKYKIEHLDINSDADDFGTTYYKNDIVFASTKAKSKMIVKNYNWTGKPFWDIYVSGVDGTQLTKPKNFDKGLNSKLHDGPASFTKDGTYMAYTSNNSKDKSNDRVVELQINFSSYHEGKWTAPESFFLNNKEYSVGQPCLTENGNTMYFTSDMPGGFGGADLYVITKDANGVWGKAENLGNKINTEGDEMFPFIEESNNILFFSSTGRFGLGGLDIFICPMNGSDPGAVYNAGYPLNTQYDDYAVIVDSKLSKGYFSSDRPGGSGGDDIYSFDISRLDIGKKLIGITEDVSSIAVPGTFVKLLDENGILIDTLTTSNDGSFSFLVASDKYLKLIGQKEKYNDGDTITSTFGNEYIIKADVILLKEKEIVADVPVGVDLGEMVLLKTIYFDLDKYNIRPDAEAELAKIVEIMNKNPEMVVELSSYTDCRESTAYNQTLSDERAVASIAYIKKRITSPERIFGKGYGESNLINGCTCDDNIGSNCTEEEHQQNRRTEFIIVKK